MRRIRAEPSAALNGYDGMAPFHHTAYAASYTARSATLQAMPQATPWRRFDKTRHGYAGRKIPTGKARKSRNVVSVACNAILFLQYVILYYIAGPICRDPTAMYTPTLRYKNEEYVKPGQAKPDTTQARIHSEQSRSQPLESTSNTTHSGRRALRSGSPNHSKPSVFIVFLHLDWTNASFPPSTHPLGLGGCTTPPGCGFAHHDIWRAR